jgi:hypothetical protein
MTVHRRPGWVAIALLSGCVDTDLDGVAAVLPCTHTLEPDIAAEAQVVVSSALVEGNLVCSGVAIGKTLVVTAMGCVFRPGEISDPDDITNPEDLETLPDGLYASVTDRACDREQDWAPLEDGSFSADFGKPLATAQMAVYRLSAPDQLFDVKQVFSSGATSRCSPGIALLVLERELDVTPLPIRFSESSRPGETVLLNDSCLDPGFQFVSQSLSAEIQAITFARSQRAIPARSLQVSQAVTALTIGGAVMSPASGALIGVVISGTDFRCAATDPSASTLAVRLAPFREMLLDVGADEGIALQAEPDPSVAAPTCSD